MNCEPILAALGDDLPDQALRLALLAGGTTDGATIAGQRKRLRPGGANAAFVGWQRPEKYPLVSTCYPWRREPQRWWNCTGGSRAMLWNRPCCFQRPARLQIGRHNGRANGRRKSPPRMGGEPFDLRDIRRTCRNDVGWPGDFSRDTRAQLLSHGLGGVQATCTTTGTATLTKSGPRWWPGKTGLTTSLPARHVPTSSR
jgi:hypothetical protein